MSTTGRPSPRGCASKEGALGSSEPNSSSARGYRVYLTRTGRTVLKKGGQEPVEAGPEERVWLFAVGVLVGSVSLFPHVFHVGLVRGEAYSAARGPSSGGLVAGASGCERRASSIDDGRHQFGWFARAGSPKSLGFWAGTPAALRGGQTCTTGRRKPTEVAQ